MNTERRVGLNPLPWYLGPEGIVVTERTVRAALSEIATTTFRAVQADVPADLTVAQFAALLAEYDMVCSPGYYSAVFDGTADLGPIVEAAKLHAATQVELGVGEVFLAADMERARMGVPGRGVGMPVERLARTVEGVATVAAAIRAEGIRPCLHPHIGSGIEVEEEVRAVLDGVPASDLWFGPDTGHMFWAGMDVAAIVKEYADRVGGVHLKDAHADVWHESRDGDWDYNATSALGRGHLWAELGRGDVDLVGVLEALPAEFDGWLVVEVDVPDRCAPLESTRISETWLTAQLH